MIESAPNVTLSNQDASMMDRLGKPALEDLCLQPAFQEVFDLQRQHVIETHAGLVKHTNSDEATDEGVTLEETLRVLRIELKEFTSGTTDLGEHE